MELQAKHVIAGNLAQRGYCVHFTGGEADFAMCQLATEFSQKDYCPVIVTVDSDLLVFGKDVFAVLFPTYSDRSFTVRYHVNEIMEMSYDKLLMAY